MNDETDGARKEPGPDKVPGVNMMTGSDIRAALSEGLSDFARAPVYAMFFGGAFALMGVAILLSLSWWDLPWLIYPFAIGFPLIGPFAAVGLFEISRRLERGEALSWNAVLAKVWLQRGRELAWMGMVMLFVFWIWMYQIRLLIALILGRMSFSTLDRFLTIVLTTEQGWIFLAIGHVVGAALALILFSLTVISIPLLMERDIDVVTAMITSVKAVLMSPVTMLGWGVFVTIATIVACVPFFLGLLVVLPVLGFATWHIFRRAVTIPDAR
jgi:uncharacterized membrane protein